MLIIFRLITFVIRVIPLRCIYFFSIPLSKLVSFFLSKDRAISDAQLRYVFGDTIDLKSTFQKSIQNSILSVCEIIKIKSIFQSDKIDSCENPNLKTQLGLVTCADIDLPMNLLAEGKNALCLTSHYSNFDLLAAYFSYQGLRMSVMARTANNAELQSLLNDLRLNYGVEMLWREGADKTAMLRAIKKKYMICALIDQDINLENFFSPFFGIEAAYPAAPIQLAVRLKMPIIMCMIHRSPDMKYEICLRRIDWEYREDPVPYILSTYGTFLETYIKKDPTQWVWWHRRWRRRPDINYNENPELLRSTREYLEWLCTQKNSQT